MTVNIPEFQLSPETQIGKVVLKVASLEEMIAFYTDIIGFSLLEKQYNLAILGTDKRILLELIQVEKPLPRTRKTGLFHMAILLPSRKDLGNALVHYLKSNAPIDGASDHGYSEALYLTDPEGNGIEVYRDKPMTEWDIREDGEIVGVTEEMDADGVLAAATQQQTSFPEDTIIGHVHLKVADLAQTERFYTEIVGLSLKNNFGKEAKFFAVGSYHHQIGSNTWLGKGVPAMEANDLGLAYYTFLLPNQEAYKKFTLHLAKLGLYEPKGNTPLSLVDPNGILVKFEYKSES
jgi:catechol 2,3-dioxygenase